MCVVVSSSNALSVLICRNYKTPSTNCPKQHSAAGKQLSRYVRLDEETRYSTFSHKDESIVDKIKRNLRNPVY